MPNSSVAAETSPNCLQEDSLLGAAQLERWRGLPIGWFNADQRERTSEVQHANPLLAFLDTGVAQARFRIDGRSRTLDLGAGAMGLFAPTQPSNRSEWCCKGVRRIVVDFDFARLGGLVDDGLFASPLLPTLEFRDPNIAALLRAMAAEVHAGCPNGALFAQSLSLGLALYLWQHHAVRAPARQRGRLNARELARVEEAVQSGLGGAVSLDEMAAAAGFSKAHFVRLFRNTVGCSPHRYVLLRRVDKARRLVETTTLPLAIVAADAGFAGQSHLTEVFARMLGTTPGRMRREARTQARRA